MSLVVEPAAARAESQLESRPPIREFVCAMIHDIRHIHFLGICGTAMGAVAAALRERGFTVTGSDENIYPPMSTFLEEKGVRLNNGYRPENIPAEADLIVIGN